MSTPALCTRNLKRACWFSITREKLLVVHRVQPALYIYISLDYINQENATRSMNVIALQAGAHVDKLVQPRAD